MDICNGAGEVMARGLVTDRDAARWFLDNGRIGDVLADTGESMADVVTSVFPSVVCRFDRNGALLPLPADERDAL